MAATQLGTGSDTLAPLSGRARRTFGGLALCAVLLLVSAAVALCLGPARLSLAEVLSVLLGLSQVEAGSASAKLVLLEIRLPRVVLAAAVGAATAMAGAVLQGLFRNALADPGLIGISPGAALGAVAWIVFGATLAPLAAHLPVIAQGLALPLAAFVGALGAALLLQGLAQRRGVMSTATLLLAGIALGAFLSAVTGLLIFLADDQQLREFTFWSLGSLGGANWVKVLSVAPFLLALLVAAPFLARGLDAMTLGDEVAFHVGIDVDALKRWAVLVAAAGVGAAVAVSGVVGFVGLMVPHLVRMLIGPAHRLLLPGAALLGAALIIAADTVARTVVAPAELPLGVVTAFVGAPFLLWLLLRARGGSSI